MFLFDARSGDLTELRSGDGEYYGLTWRRGAILVGHSRVNNEDLLTNADLQAADRGDVTSHSGGSVVDGTPRRLFLAHQIEWVDDRLLVVDTGRERLSAYAYDGTLIQDVSLGSHDWALGPDGLRGHHFNSVHRSGDRVWVVAHNYDDPSEIWELTWPGLELIKVHPTGAAWAHNTWDGELGLVTCDSRFGRLHEVGSGETIWTADEDEVLTRGLAVSPDHLFIGPIRVRGTRRASLERRRIMDRRSDNSGNRRTIPFSGDRVRQRDSATRRAR